GAEPDAIGGLRLWACRAIEIKRVAHLQSRIVRHLDKIVALAGEERIGGDDDRRRRVRGACYPVENRLEGGQRCCVFKVEIVYGGRRKSSGVVRFPPRSQFEAPGARVRIVEKSDIVGSNPELVDQRIRAPFIGFDSAELDATAIPGVLGLTQ